MIIGNGSLANLLEDRKGSLFFCSGVSNSQNVTDEGRIRELNLLKYYQICELCLFYFSSIMAPIKCSEYYNHKTQMEEFVKVTFPNYWIIRLGNIWECTNPNTFLNKMKYWERNGKLTDDVVKDELKYMIHADTLNMILQSLPLTGKHEISVFEEMLTVKQCLER